MAKQGAVTRKDVEQLLGCSSFPANKALAALVEQGNRRCQRDEICAEVGL